jgi:aminoglycoside phosphotransferase (APT) family kinase protein
MEQAIATYLAPRLNATGDVSITHLLRIPGGASRETWMFKATWHDGDGRHAQEFVLRKDPPASLLDTDREVEYAYYSSFFGSEVPVPRMRWLEPDPKPLGGSFFIMERIGGCETAPRTLMEPRYQPVHPTVTKNFYRILGAIARFDWANTDIARVAKAPTVDTTWDQELTHWETIINDNELSPQPIMRAAIRWLRANPPPPAQRVSVVHGDYRVGNFLFTADGSINGILDWEMAHLGDPLEDLAWSFNESWQWAGKNGKQGRPGGICTVDEACALWEQHSGMTADRDAIHWWWVFCDVKCQGIWLTGTKSFQEGRTRELILPVVSYMLINGQDESVLRTMGRGA